MFLVRPGSAPVPLQHCNFTRRHLSPVRYSHQADTLKRRRQVERIIDAIGKVDLKDFATEAVVHLADRLVTYLSLNIYQPILR